MDDSAANPHPAHPPSPAQPLRLAPAPTRWLAVTALIVVALAGSVVQERPEHGKRIDEANLSLAAALAERDAAVTQQANRTAAHEVHVLRLRSHADHVSHLDLTLDQLGALMHPPESHPEPPLAWPVQGLVVSGYGLRAWPDFGRIHPGIDITNLPGTPIHAAAHGTVVAARHDRLRGNSVIIDHGEQEQHPGRWTTVYGHLADIDVAQGQEVSAGEQIGTLGNTGTQTTGPHLHFEVRIEGKPVDPRRWLP